MSIGKIVGRKMDIEIREMSIDDCEDAIALWEDEEGIIVDDDDSKQGIERYLKRNPGLSFVAYSAESLVGVALCGHDGRRGILRHMAVNQDHRNQQIPQQLVAKCVSGLRMHGIEKCNAFVLEKNTSGQSFWKRLGFSMLPRDFKIMQMRTSDNSE